MEQYSKEQLDYKKHVMKVYMPDCTVFYDMLTGNQIITHMNCKPEETDKEDVFSGFNCLAGTEYEDFIHYENFLRIHDFLKMGLPWRSIN